MIKNIKHILVNYLEWLKSDFIILVALILLLSAGMQLVQPHEMIVFIIYCGLFVKCIMFINLYSLNPSANSIGDRFSWKFMQGLPINKKDLLIALSLSRLILFLPLLLLAVVNWSDVKVFNNSFSDGWKDPNVFIFIFDYCLLIILSGVISVHSTINFPRVQYVNQIATNKMLIFSRKSLMYIFGLLYLGIIVYQLETQYNINILIYAKEFMRFVVIILNSWWLPPILMACIAFTYEFTLKSWLDEKNAYKRQDINVKREWSFAIFFGVMIALPISQMDFKTPKSYGVNEFTKATYHKNYSLIRTLVKTKNINSSNEYGFTPMLVAIHEGDLKTIKFLEELGAKYDGSLNDKASGHKGYDAMMLAIDSGNQETFDYVISKGHSIKKFNSQAGFYPIQLATFKCKVNLVNQMIELGAEVNVINSKGETPAVLAVKAGCFPNALILKQAGADFNIADNKGKKALDHFKVENGKYVYKEFRDFVEKFSRVPANSSK